MYAADRDYYRGADGKASADPKAGELLVSRGAIMSDEQAAAFGLPLREAVPVAAVSPSATVPSVPAASRDFQGGSPNP